MALVEDGVLLGSRQLDMGNSGQDDLYLHRCGDAPGVTLNNHGEDGGERGTFLPPMSSLRVDGTNQLRRGRVIALHISSYGRGSPTAVQGEDP